MGARAQSVDNRIAGAVSAKSVQKATFPVKRKSSKASSYKAQPLEEAFQKISDLQNVIHRLRKKNMELRLD